MTIASEIARLQGAKADLKTAINAKGGTITDELIDEYAAFVDDIETGGGGGGSDLVEVMYMDYEGTILNTQYVQIGEDATPPTSPDRTAEGLTFVEWNDDGIAVEHDMIIGATYETTDGKTHYVLDLTSSGTSLGNVFRFIKSDTSELTINWGDGSANYTTSSSGTITTPEHTFPSNAVYEITIWISSGSGTYFLGHTGQTSSFCYPLVRYTKLVHVGSNCTGICRDSFFGIRISRIMLPNTITEYYRSFYGLGGNDGVVFPNATYSVFNSTGMLSYYEGDYASFPRNINGGWSSSSFSSSFEMSQNLKKLIIPDNAPTRLSSSNFKGCASLAKIVHKNAWTSVASTNFDDCPADLDLSSVSPANFSGSYILGNSATGTGRKGNIVMNTISSSNALRGGRCESFTLLSGTSIGAYYTYTLSFYGRAFVDLPDTITSISNNNFSQGQGSFKAFIIRATTPPTISLTFFIELNRWPTIKIYVPDDSVEAYKGETNWTVYANNIFPLSDWE